LFTRLIVIRYTKCLVQGIGKNLKKRMMLLLISSKGCIFTPIIKSIWLWWILMTWILNHFWYCALKLIKAILFTFGKEYALKKYHIYIATFLLYRWNKRKSLWIPQLRISLTIQQILISILLNRNMIKKIKSLSSTFCDLMNLNLNFIGWG